MGFLVENASAKNYHPVFMVFPIHCHSTPDSTASDQGLQLSEKKDMLTCPPLWNSLALLYFHLAEPYS